MLSPLSTVSYVCADIRWKVCLATPTVQKVSSTLRHYIFPRRKQKNLILFLNQEKFRREFSSRIPCLRPLLGDVSGGGGGGGAGAGGAGGYGFTNTDGGTGGGGAMHHSTAGGGGGGSHQGLTTTISIAPSSSAAGYGRAR